MKRMYLLLILGFVASNVLAQCEKTFDIKEGSNWTWYDYNKKGKLIGKTMQVVVEMKDAGSKRSAIMKLVTADANGNQTKPVLVRMSCDAGVINVDMKKFLPREYLEDYSLEQGTESRMLAIPINLAVGNKLGEGNLEINAGKNGSKNRKISLAIVNRKVVGLENLNSAGGSFDCHIIDQDVIAGLKKSKETKTRSWYAPGVGIVKSETYRKGKLAGYSILTTFTK